MIFLTGVAQTMLLAAVAIEERGEMVVGGVVVVAETLVEMAQGPVANLDRGSRASGNIYHQMLWQR